MKAKDGHRAARMTDDGCIIVGAQGVSTIDGPTMEKLTVEGNWQLQDYAFDEKHTQVRAWLCALHTKSINGDPFGRDKRS
jgi:hypothetical protein